MPPSERDAWLFEPEDDLRETVAAAVYRRLIDMILFGELAQGSRLRLADLARRFDVSLTPVREALQRLAEGGLIEAEPRRGYRVRTPSPRHVRDLWDVRRGLETVAAGSAAARVRSGEVGGRDLDPARRVLAELDRAPRALDHRRHLELNARFHQLVVTLSGNALLVTLYRGIQFQLITAWVQRGSAAWRGRLAAESEEHRAVMDAVAAGDAAAASAAMASHVGRSLGSALEDIDPPALTPGAKTGTDRTYGRTP